MLGLDAKVPRERPGTDLRDGEVLEMAVRLVDVASQRGLLHPSAAFGGAGRALELAGVVAEVAVDVGVPEGEPTCGAQNHLRSHIKI